MMIMVMLGLVVMTAVVFLAGRMWGGQGRRVPSPAVVHVRASDVRRRSDRSSAERPRGVRTGEVFAYAAAAAAPAEWTPGMLPGDPDLLDGFVLSEALADPTSTWAGYALAEESDAAGLFSVLACVASDISGPLDELE